MLGSSYTNLLSVPWTLQNHSHLKALAPPGHPLSPPSGMCFPIDLHASSFSSLRSQLKCHLLQEPCLFTLNQVAPLPRDKSARIKARSSFFWGAMRKLVSSPLWSKYEWISQSLVTNLETTHLWWPLTWGITLMGKSESCFWTEQRQELSFLDVPTQQWRSLIQRCPGWERLVGEVCEKFSG